MKMKEMKTIAVRMCSGCVCEFDRRKVLETLTKAFADTCEFKYSYNLNKDTDFDLALQINGCDSECAQPSELIDNLIIDHHNWEQAEELFEEKIQP